MHKSHGHVLMHDDAAESGEDTRLIASDLLRALVDMLM
jgi:hypothetical protein